METNDTTQNRTPQSDSANISTSLTDKDIEVLKLIEGTYIRLAEDTKDGFIKKDDLVIEVNDLAQKRGITDDRAWKLLGEHYPDRIEKFVADDITHLVETMVRIEEDDLKYLHELGRRFIQFIGDYNNQIGWISGNLLNSIFPEEYWKPFGFDDVEDALWHLCNDEAERLEIKETEDDYLLHVEGVPMPEEATAEQVTTQPEEAEAPKEQPKEPEQRPAATAEQTKPVRELSTKLTWDQQAQAYLLVEAAYVKTPTQRGYWKKLADVEAHYTEVAERRGISGTTFMAMLKGAFPNAKFKDDCCNAEDEPTFKGVRINNPGLFKTSNALKKHLEEAIRNTAGADGWTHMANLGNKALAKDWRPIEKAEWQQLGFRNLREALACLLGRQLETRDEHWIRLLPTPDSPTPAQNKPEQAPSKPAKAPTTKPDKTPITPDKTPITPEKAPKKPEKAPAAKPEKTPTASINGSTFLLSKSLSSWAYFPGENKKLSWTAAINQLAELAISERWYFDDKDEATKPILRNYISNTFERLQEEDAKEKKRVEGTNNEPQLKILANEQYAIWNTGLLDKIYDPIYAIFKPNPNKGEGKQEWMFHAFGTENSTYQYIFNDFENLPMRALYHEDPRDLVYDTRSKTPTTDEKHIIIHNVERLPANFLKKGCTEGFQFIDDTETLSKEQRDAYFEQLKEAINADLNWKRELTKLFRAAVSDAIARVRSNYTAAIPIYYKEAHAIQHLLPLSLVKSDKVDVALVCAHDYDSSTRVTKYSGKTILTLEMAYNDARLITRPDSGWLMSIK